MKYKDALRISMEHLAEDERTIFLGYNVLRGSRAYGTLNGVPKEKCLETPLAENLMVGLAAGLSLDGFRPVVFFERHDFLLNASDAIVNYVSKIKELSRNQFKMPILIRATIGGTKPFYPGPQHTQDFTQSFREMVSFPVITLKNTGQILDEYKHFGNSENPVMMVEWRDLYDSE